MKKLYIFALVFLFMGCSLSANGEKENSNDYNSEVHEMFITIDGRKETIRLENNKSAETLIKILESGDLTLRASEYGGFERVASFGFSLPSNDVRITTKPGDVVLYSSDSIVMFYGSNTWAYTKLGRIEGLSTDELKTFFKVGRGSIDIILSLN